MISAERRVYIMKCLQKKSIVSLKEIASELDVSEITVRRDFEKLENAGKLKRIQGGAALEECLDNLDNVEISMKEKISLYSQEKRLVAKHAAKLVKEGDCVFLDSGTSIAPTIDYLASKKITIVTCNQLVLRKLTNPVAVIHVIGGVFLPHYSVNVGPEAQETLSRFRFDVTLLGCVGLETQKNISYDTAMDTLHLKEIAFQNSSKNVLLIDSSKFGKSSYLKFKELDAFDKIICNKPDIEIADKRIEFVSD